MIVKARPFFVLLAILSPAFAWLLLNRAPFSGDEAVYGRASLDLFRTLVDAPADWIPKLFTVLPFKPNALVWIGQFFVPAGDLLGSIDAGLLVSVWVTQLGTAVLVYAAVRQITSGDTSTAILATLVVASAPLFVTLGGYYMVESVQTLAVAWFVLIVACADTWAPAYTLCHLVAASAFALLTKTTTPIFCVWPGLWSLWAMRQRWQGADAWSWREPRVAVMTVVGVVFAAIATTWYYRNWLPVTMHARAASSGPVATVWGKEDTFFNTFVFWAQESAARFFVEPMIVVPVLLVLIAAATAMKSRSSRFDRVMLAAVLQVPTVFGVFAFGSNRSSRYLLPMLPYVAVMVSWSVHRIGRRPILVLAIAASAVQLAVVQAVAFDLVPNMLKHDVVGLVPLRTIDRHGQQARVLEDLVSRTCHEEGARKYLNIVAIDPNLQGDWLAPEPANYVAERNLVKRSRQPACEYGYVGRSFFGAPAADAWQMLIDDSVRYVITIDPAMYQPPADAVNETLKPESFRLLWTNLTTTGFFEREPPLTADPGIVVFRRLNDLGRGRALSDRGAHEQAIVILRGVAAAEPSNVEAWANLALALERAGQFDEAIRAGLRARSLDPKHYYVNLGLARSLFSVGNAVRGCDYLRTAGEQQTTPDILSQMASHGCEK